MALAKNRNKDTLIGLWSREGSSTPGLATKLYGNEFWGRRGSMLKNNGNSGAHHGARFCTIRAGARRGRVQAGLDVKCR